MCKNYIRLDLVVFHKAILSTAIDSELALIGQPSEVKIEIALKIQKTFKKATNQNTNFDEIKTIKNLNTKIENNDLIVSKADKGQSVTIIKKKNISEKWKISSRWVMHLH